MSKIRLVSAIVGVLVLVCGGVLSAQASGSTKLDIADRGGGWVPGTPFVVYLGDESGTPLHVLHVGVIPGDGRPDLVLNIPRPLDRGLRVFYRSRYHHIPIGDDPGYKRGRGRVPTPDIVKKPQWTVGRLHPYIHCTASSGSCAILGQGGLFLTNSGRGTRLGITAMTSGGGTEEAAATCSKGPWTTATPGLGGTTVLTNSGRGMRLGLDGSGVPRPDESGTEEAAVICSKGPWTAATPGLGGSTVLTNSGRGMRLGLYGSGVPRPDESGTEEAKVDCCKGPWTAATPGLGGSTVLTNSGRGMRLGTEGRGLPRTDDSARNGAVVRFMRPLDIVDAGYTTGDGSLADGGLSLLFTDKGLTVLSVTGG